MYTSTAGAKSVQGQLVPKVHNDRGAGVKDTQKTAGANDA